MRRICIQALGFCVLAGLALAGCMNMHTPRNGQQVCGANANVQFSGYIPFAGKSVQIQVATAANGPWTTVGNITSSSTNYYTVDGVNYYSFSKSFQLSKWTSVAEGGAQLKSFVRARVYIDSNLTPNPYWATVTTFDVTPPIGSSPIECMQTRINAGDTGPEANEYCKSDESPVVELIAPAQTTCGGCSNVVVNGDVTINSPLTAAQYVCTQTINGSLTVTEAAPETVALPALQTITGNLTASYSYPFANGANAFRRRVMDLPALTSIGGDATLEAKRWQGSNVAPSGLNAVTSVGGDITITVRDANPNVFGALTSHEGNLTLQGLPNGSLDINANNSFEQLTEVTGDVTVRWFYSTNGVLNPLETVNGDLFIGAVRFYPSASFNSLETVTGNLELNAMKQLGPPWANAVAIGGELAFVDTDWAADLSLIPLASATAGSLRIEGNLVLDDLGGTGLQIGAGNIVISGNPALSQCEVNEFLAAQQAGGWAGSALVSDTVPCP